MLRKIFFYLGKVPFQLKWNSNKKCCLKSFILNRPEVYEHTPEM